MLLNRHELAAIAEGRATRVYRRWRRPNVRAGGTQKTAIGLLAIDAVEPLEPAAIDDAEAAAGGFESPEALLASLVPEGQLYRVTVRVAGPDPRIALRERQASTVELDDLVQRLDRIDARSGHGPWAWEALGLIARSPGVRAATLAASVGRETQPFKVDVRKLKELGLTESLEVGYRLSPRGAALLEHANHAPRPLTGAHG